MSDKVRANNNNEDKEQKKAPKISASLSQDGIGVTIEALFKGMQGIASSKTVVGDPIYIDDVIMVPLVEVSAGLASGALERNAKQNGAGAMSAKVSPVAMLIMQNGRFKLINVKNQDIFTKLADLIPDAVDKLTDSFIPKHYEDEAKEKLDDMGIEIIDPEKPDDSDNNA